MASTTVFELISASLGKSLETIMIPNFAEVAAQVASQFGEEPPSQDSMKVLFEDAFKKSLANPGKKKVMKPKTPKSPKTPKKETSEKKEKAPAKPKTPKSPKAKRTPVPKPQWVTLNEMEQLLNADDKQYFCGFVADRGPNKGKFCATVLTEEHKNCGTLTADGWTSHTPEKEFESVEQIGHKMRCKKCWAKGKNGCYRKEGSAEKTYPEAFAKAQAELEQESIPEIPDVPNDDIVTPVETTVETNEIEEEPVEEKTEDGSDKSEVEETDNELEEVEEETGDGSDEPTTEELLDGLLDDGPVIEGM